MVVCFHGLSVCSFFIVIGVFPEPDKDPVIQIGAMVIRQGETEPFARTILTLKDCAPIVGTQVQCFAKEIEMLEVSVVYAC